MILPQWPPRVRTRPCICCTAAPAPASPAGRRQCTLLACWPAGPLHSPPSAPLLSCSGALAPRATSLGCPPFLPLLLLEKPPHALATTSLTPFRSPLRRPLLAEALPVHLAGCLSPRCLFLSPVHYLPNTYQFLKVPYLSISLLCFLLTMLY